MLLLSDLSANHGVQDIRMKCCVHSLNSYQVPAKTGEVNEKMWRNFDFRPNLLFSPLELTSCVNRSSIVEKGI